MPSGLGRQQYRGCEIYNDFRELLARDDIDAVWGCVPDHWHGVVYSRAIEAGKDLYGEKPVTRWISQGIRIRDAVRQYGCVFQTGTQQRSSTALSPRLRIGPQRLPGQGPHDLRRCPRRTSYPAEPPCEPPARI